MMSIGELARQAGVSRRTVRYYVEIGLLPPPEGAARAAAYGPEHLSRLEMIKLLQARRLTLEEIREHLAGEPLSVGDAADAPPSQDEPRMSRLSSASEYLSDLQKSMPEVPALGEPQHRPPFYAAGPAPLGPLPPAVPREHRLESPVEPYLAEQWLRIPLSAEIELHVKRKGGRMDRRLSKLIREARRILEEEKQK